MRPDKENRPHSNTLTEIRIMKKMHPLLRLARICNLIRNSNTLSDGEEDIRNYKIYLPVRVGDVTVEGMLDSGNLWRSALSWEMAQKMGINKKDLRAVPGYSTIGTAAEEGKLEVLGETIRKVRINLGGGTADITCRPVVIKNLSMPLNISGPFMRRNQIDILHNGEAVIRGTKVQMNTKEGEFGQSSSVHSLIYVTENTTVGSMERCWLNAIAKSVRNKDFAASELLVVGDGAFTEKYDLHPMTQAIVNCEKDGTMQVLALNTTGQSIRVKKGSIYGIGFQTTTVKKRKEEPWKVCVLEPNSKLDDPEQSATGKIPKANPEPTIDKNAEEIKQWKIKHKIPPDFDFSLESYLAGTHKLPSFMVGPTTAKNRIKRIAYVIKFFKLEENKFLKDKADMQATVKLLLNYFDIWAFSGDYGHTHLIEHHIELEPGTRPICERYRPPNPLLETSMKQQLDGWLRTRVIEESKSPWNFSLVAAIKKGGKVRWCTGAKIGGRYP